MNDAHQVRNQLPRYVFVPGSSKYVGEVEFIRLSKNQFGHTYKDLKVKNG